MPYFSEFLTSSPFSGADVWTASIGPADIPLLVADLAYVRGMVHRQLHDEDRAQVWLSKATINTLIPALKDNGATDIIELPLSKIVH